MKREYRNRAVTWAILSVSTDTRLIVLHNNCMCVIELNEIYMVICSVLLFFLMVHDVYQFIILFGSIIAAENMNIC